MASRDDLSQFFESIEAEPGLKSAIYFENFVLELLRLESRGAIAVQPSEGGGIGTTRGRLDAILLGDTGHLSGPTGVEIVHWDPAGASRSRVHAKARRFREILSENGFRQGLLVHNLPEAYYSLPPSGDIQIWGRERLLSLGALHLDALGEVASAPARSAVKRTLIELKDNGRSRFESHFRRMRADYGTNGLVLFLGAGVSAGSGLPGWSSLIGQLFSTAMKDEISALSPEHVAAMIKTVSELNGNSPLMVARYLKSIINDTDEFEERIHSVLYRNYDSSSRSALLSAVTRLCSQPGTGSVHAVVSYNFDSLLEGDT